MSPEKEQILDTQKLRKCLGRFATGVTVVSLASEQGPRALTVNAFTSVSLDPPLIVVSIAKKARSHDLFRGRPFTVNVLTTAQEGLARHFAGDPQPDMEISWIEGKAAPRLRGVIAWIECEPFEAYAGGDHTLYLGRVIDFDCGEGDALGYFASRFVSIPRPLPSEPPLPYDPFELPYDAPL